MLISVEGTGKNHLGPGQESMGDSPLLSQSSLLRNPWSKAAGMLEHVVKKKPTVDSPFFGTFPSGRISKATKNVNVHSFIHSFTSRDEFIMENARTVKNSCKLYQRILKLLCTFTNCRHFG
jgi:hypothetical protein